MKKIGKPRGDGITEEHKQIIRESGEKGLSKFKIRMLTGLGTKNLLKYMKEYFPEYRGTFGASSTTQEKRIESLEMQMEILIEQIRRLNDKIK